MRSGESATAGQGPALSLSQPWREDAAGGAGPAAAFPLSPAQLPIWYSEMLSPNTPRWTLVTAAFLRGPVDTARLADAARSAERRFASLRTRLHLDGHRPSQSFAEPGPDSVRVHDLSAEPPAARPRLRDALLLRERGARFELYDAPLHHVLVIRLGPEEHVLALCEHHTAIDAVGVAIVFRYVARLHDGGTAEAGPDRAYERWLDRRRAPEALPGFDEALAHHARALAGAAFRHENAYDLPADKARAAGYVPPNLLDVTRGLEAGVVAGLREFRARRGCSLFVVFLAAYAQVLSRLVGSADLVVGVVVSGRAGETDDIVGMCVNTVPLRLAVGEAGTADAGTEAAAAAWGEASRFQTVPLIWLSQAASPGAIPAAAQFVINMMDMRHTPCPIAGVEQHVRYVTNAYPTGDLVFSPTGFEDGTIGLRMIVNSPRISRQRTEAILDAIATLLAGWAA